MSEYSINLMQPAVLKVRAEVPIGDGAVDIKETKVDVFEAWRFLDESNKQPSPQAKWNMVRKWLGEKLGLNGEAAAILADNTLLHFHETVYAIGNLEQRKIANFLSSIVSSQQPTPESLATTPGGQSSISKPGLPTSPTS